MNPAGKMPFSPGYAGPNTIRKPDTDVIEMTVYIVFF